MFWRDRSVLVTGCTGLLGSWLSRSLVERGAATTGLIRDWIPESILVEERVITRMNIVRGQVEDYKTLERVLGEYEIETVFHLAAQTIVGIANRNPISTFETNVRGTWNLLEACRRSPMVKRVVVASSDKAYGEHASLPYTEEAALNGAHPYDVSKSCADLIARAYFSTYALPVCVTRCGNFYGGGDLNFNRLVPGTIRSAFYNENPKIRSDGRLIRDYIYIGDAVEAYLLLAEKMDDSAIHGLAFNFSNELQLTVLEMVEAILRVCDASDLTPQILNEATSEIPHQYLSADRARRLLGWRPTYTLEEGLRETVRWYYGFFRRKHDMRSGDTAAA